MLDHIFLSYESNMTVDLENNLENMRKAWDTQTLVETLLKYIQDCMDSAESCEIKIGE